MSRVGCDRIPGTDVGIDARTDQKIVQDTGVTRSPKTARPKAPAARGGHATVLG